MQQGPIYALQLFRTETKLAFLYHSREKLCEYCKTELFCELRIFAIELLVTNLQIMSSKVIFDVIILYTMLYVICVIISYTMLYVICVIMLYTMLYIICVICYMKQSL